VSGNSLFLFFSWFRRVERSGSRWEYSKNSKPAHALWGWLSVERSVDPKNLRPGDARWLSYHPHVNDSGDDRHLVYVAREHLNVGGRAVPGAGIFPRFTPHRVLTAAGENMSVWAVPLWMHPSEDTVSFSYIYDPSRWRRGDGGTARVKTIGKGQEIVMTPSDRAPVDEWLATVFADVPSLVP
jgi:hypothetical protein